MSIEALKQALDALETYKSFINDAHIIEGQWDWLDGLKEVADFLRQTIAEAEKQEPVGWIDNKGNMICTKINESCKPLYAHPQPREWVGLTDEETDAIIDMFAGDPWTAVEEIKARLKEKNT